MRGGVSDLTWGAPGRGGGGGTGGSVVGTLARTQHIGCPSHRPTATKGTKTTSNKPIYQNIPPSLHVDRTEHSRIPGFK